MKKLLLLFILAFGLQSAFASDLSYVVVNATSGFSDGSINLTVSGGVAPYTYAWTGPSGFTATTEDISALSSGYYTVTVTDKYCGIATVTIFVDVATSIKENSNTMALSVYPNPVNQTLYIQSSGSIKNGVLEIFTISGVKVLEKTGLSGETLQINVESLDSGLYLVQLTDNKNTLRKRFVKN
jgi:hypothetical protein